MLSLDWALIADWLVRYYFPAMLLIPMILILCLFDRRLVDVNRKTMISMCVMLVLLIIVDVADNSLTKVKHFTMWRVAFSVLGFTLRPACLLVLLLDLKPELRHRRKKRLMLCLPAIINGAVFSTAFVSPLTFSYDAQNNYHRGPLFAVTVIVGVLYLVMLTYSAITGVHRRSRRRGFAVLIIAVACFIASIL